ncbi:MAG: hypothetical protein IJ064_02855 [Bacteroidaceae bacterium]|nr:hypothetical protein [Bacteroidaceae bacterium]
MKTGITRFLTLLVAFFMAASAQAQLPELQGKSVSVGGAVADFEPDTWYFLHQQRVLNDNKVAHSEVGGLPEGAGFIHDEGAGNVIYTRSIDNVPEGSSAASVAGYLVRFVPSSEHEGAYLMQFGTGNYLSIPDGAQNRTQMPTVVSIYDATELDVYKIEDTDGHFAMNQYPMGVAINCTGVGYPVPIWGSGRNTSIDGNADYSFHAAIWETLSERDAALKELEATLIEYREYLSNLQPIGTNPGEYGEAEVAAFEAALNAGDLDNPDSGIDEMTAEEIRQLIQNIISTYQAALASRVPMTLADGYYRLKTGQRYYIIETDEETMEDIEREVDKYMNAQVNGETINARWGSSLDLDSDASVLWQVKNLAEGRLSIVNVATQATFTTVSTSTAVTLSTEGTAEIEVTPAGTVNGITYVNLNVHPLANNRCYLHQDGHTSGKGEGGPIVGWEPTYDREDQTPHASEWQFIPVSDEEAQAIIEAYKPYQDREAMLNEYKTMLADAKAKLEIARDVQKIVDETPLITDAGQLSSPCSDAEEGLNIEYLIDGDVSTFWHSDWHNAYSGAHYLQVEIREADVQNAVMQFTRRNNSGNQIIDWAVYGTDSYDAEQDECEHLTDITTPVGSFTETLTSNVFPTQGKKYIRFYFVRTTGNKTPVFAHMAEFQMFRAEVYQSPTCQYNVLGALATNLEKVISDQADLELEDITTTEYTALKQAYEAFIAKFVDPAPLRSVLTSTKDIASVVVTGTDPGFWSTGSGAANLLALYDEAKAYDEAGNYTAEQSQQYIDRLNQEKEDIYASANPIREGKWYRLRFASEEEYEQHGWDKSGANSKTNEAGQFTAFPLFGKYVLPAEFNSEDHEVVITESSDLGLGSHLYFAEPDEISDATLSHFRFIAVGDTAYMLQNRATGLFLKATGTSGSVTLSVHPSLFDATRAIGYGLNVIKSRSITGENQNYLHAQRDNNTLVTWDAYTPGSNSAFFIEEAADVAADYDGTEFQIPLTYGSLTGLCFPVEISAKESDTKLWTLNSIQDNVATLGAIEGGAAGGRPFFLQYGDLDQYQADDVADMVTLRHGYAITGPQPQTDTPIKGSYTSEVVGAGVIVAEGNALVVSKRSNTRVAANGAYIATEGGFDLEAVISLQFSETDGIQATPQDAASGTANTVIYTIDGRRVSNAQRLTRGIYIQGGTKVIVK